MTIIGAIIYIAVCYFVGVFAEERGRSKIGWMLGSLFVSPLLCFIVLLLLGRKK